MELPEIFTVVSHATGREVYSGPRGALIWELRGHAHNLRRLGVITQDDYMWVIRTGLNPLRAGGSFSAEYETLMQLSVAREDLF